MRQQSSFRRLAPWGIIAAFALCTAQAREAGDIIKECDVCPEIVVVPTGTFKMGWDGAEPVRPG